MRAFRIRGYVHPGLVPGLVAMAVVSALSGMALASDPPQGLTDTRAVQGFVFAAGSVLVFFGFAWHTLLAYGVLPAVVVWRREGGVWVGTLLTFLRLDSRRIRVNPRDFWVDLELTQRTVSGAPMSFDLRLTSAGTTVVFRTRGVLDVAELHMAAVSSAIAVEEERSAPDGGPA